MQKYEENLAARVNGALQPLMGVDVTVLAASGLPATIYTDDGVTVQKNPMTTDANGYFGFFAANGTYSLSFSGAQVGNASRSVTLYDPADDLPLTQAQAAAPSGASKIGVGTESVENALDALQLADFGALRAYRGPRKSAYVTGYLGTAAPSGIAGMFVRDDNDTTTVDDGGIVIVATNGKRWKRCYSGEALPEMFGAKGFGVDDTVAVQAAMNTGKYKLSTQYTITSKLTAPANSRGIGPGSLSKGGNFDMIELGSGAKMSGITLIGNGSTRTGRGIIITGGTDQRLIDCDVLGMNGYCVEYTTAQAGLRGTINGGMYYRQDTTQPAIKYPPNETNGDRRLLNIDCVGGVLADLSGSATTLVSGCDTTGLLFAAGTQKAIVNGNRIATMGGSVTVMGVDNIISGNCIAGDLLVGPGAQNNTVGRNTLAAGYKVKDQSGNATNFVDTLGEDIVPVWQASGTPPSIGNGTISGRLVRNGKRVLVSWQLTANTTTTFGTGAWSFSLPPEYANLTVKFVSEGSAAALRSGVAFRIGAVTAPAGAAPVFSIYNDGGTNSWGATNPVTWGSSDYVRCQIEFEIG